MGRFTRDYLKVMLPSLGFVLGLGLIDRHRVSRCSARSILTVS